jgi:hypothetical protein
MEKIPDLAETPERIAVKKVLADEIVTQRRQQRPLTFYESLDELHCAWSKLLESGKSLFVPPLSYIVVAVLAALLTLIIAR